MKYLNRIRNRENKQLSNESLWESVSSRSECSEPQLWEYSLVLQSWPGATVCSRVGTEPVSLDLVGLEHLFSELLVSSVLDGIDLKSVRVGVHVMVLGEQVRHGVEGGNDACDHADDYLLVGHLALAEVAEVLGHVVGHLGGRGGDAVFVLNHAVVQLRGHGDDHVIVVGVEVAALGNVKTEGGCVVVTSKEVVRVVDQTWLVSVCL
ncbi:hypothetical protein FGO68_gene4872 [Halteria grandinella]|uniref:Uncharacterized protein n=1 Tax=Halteria grandinella TaxID=5974 RepID=A0A8J8P5B2_HALGN|nr:hypothetical protein FGO68_gene4872 [Halteria grandinella]